MNFRTHCAAAVILLTACIAACAQDRGFWRAQSKTASAITGDIAIAEDKLTINFSAITIAQIRSVTPAEMKAVFDTDSTTAKGNLYRLSVPARKVFLHRNTLCGAEDTQWMVTSVAGKMLQVAFFSGGKMPVLTPEVVANTTALCGTYSYGH